MMIWRRSRYGVGGFRFNPAGMALSFVVMMTGSVAAAGAGLSAEPGDSEDLVGDPRRSRPIERHGGVQAFPDFTAPEESESMQGGAGTQSVRFDGEAFSLPAANLSLAEQANFAIGNAIFRKLWVSAPASTRSSDGLGPLFNARSCQSCHLKDGRGHPPVPGESEPAVSFIMMLSVRGEDGVSHSDPVYGVQIQDFAVQPLSPEAFIRVTYTEKPFVFADGERVFLRVPHYEPVGLSYGALTPAVTLSPRVAPQMIGLGLLEAIADADILVREDPEDGNGDGISGRVSLLEEPNGYGSVIGRFGLKAMQAGVRQQAAAAFANDMGLATSLRNWPHGDCTKGQQECFSLPVGAAGGTPEVSDQILDLIEFYARNIAVPARRSVDDVEVLRGKELFHEVGCASCHTPKYVTRADKMVPENLRGQLIWPYTDLLLHDVGEGLADVSLAGEVTDREWKTPPLWGIGLTRQVSGHEFFLHDGRARGFLEAILWHGGEAQRSRDSFAKLLKKDREALLRFLESL